MLETQRKTYACRFCSYRTTTKISVCPECGRRKIESFFGCATCGRKSPQAFRVCPGCTTDGLPDMAVREAYYCRECGLGFEADGPVCNGCGRTSDLVSAIRAAGSGLSALGVLISAGSGLMLLAALTVLFLIGPDLDALIMLLFAFGFFGPGFYTGILCVTEGRKQRLSGIPSRKLLRNLPGWFRYGPGRRSFR